MKPKKVLKSFLLLIGFLFSLSICSQNLITVTGKVLDNGVPIPGATVTVKNTNNGTVTDFDGNYSLTAASNAIIVVSYVGFKTMEEPVNNRNVINFNLTVNLAELEEVVVVGYGTQTSRSVTGSVQQVAAGDFEDIPVSQITQKLQGRLVGVQINQTTGRPGQGVQVRIRGQASISAGTEPLYVVDGLPIIGDISQIPPDEIESITVLKDAASTSLYGSRASNGVVLVNTKRAKAGQNSLSVNTYVGVQNVPQKGRPKLMNGTEFAQFKKESFEDLGQPVPEIFQDPSKFGKGFNWFKAMLRDAVVHSYNVTWLTGNEKSTTAVTGEFFNQEGVMINTDYKRYSLRLNSDYKIKENLKVGFSAAPTYIVDNIPSSDGIFFAGNVSQANPGGLINNAMLAWPIIPFKNEDGTLPLTAFIPGLSAFPNPNWVRAAKEIKNETESIRILANAFLEYKPIKDLMLKTSFNIDFGRSKFFNFKPSTTSVVFTALPPVTATSVRRQNNFLSWLSENTAVYTKSIGEHNFDVLGGYSLQKFDTENSQLFLSDFPDDRIRTIQSAVNVNRAQSFDNNGESALISWFSRLNYSYKDRYFVSGSVRRDGSSKFGSDNRWGNFYSVSGGWVFTDEKFFEKIPLLSFGKLRASFGTTGNNNVGDFTQFPIVNNSLGGVFGNTIVSGAAATSLGNSKLGWEKSKQFDAGIELNFLDNRIMFAYDYYRKNTNDLLFNVEIPQESGFSNFNDNAGKFRFWGHELSLTTRNFTGDFKWTSQYNISFNKNKVISLAEGVDQLFSVATGTFTSISQVGKPIGQFWGLVHNGIFVDQADFDNSPKQVESQVGTVKFLDVNGDGVITTGLAPGADDRTVIGDPNPDALFGITNEFQYKNFDLGIVISGAIGNDIVAATEQGTTNLDGVFNVLKEVKDRYRSPQNPGSGKFGKTTAATFLERDNFNSRFVQNASYLTIKNITLGYTVPFKENSFLSKARIYGSIQEVYTFTGYSGANPEVSGNFNGTTGTALLSGFDFAAFPVPRTFTLGLNLSF